jgi:Rrf2 family protein
MSMSDLDPRVEAVRMVSRTAELAVRAVLFLARRANDGPQPAGVVAEALDLPPNYLAKTLNRLARSGVVVSNRGAAGGFALAIPADDLTLAHVIEAFDRPRPQRVCMLGDRPCDMSRPCSAHRRWSRLTRDVFDGFRLTTVAQLLTPDEADGSDVVGSISDDEER